MSNFLHRARHSLARWFAPAPPSVQGAQIRRFQAAAVDRFSSSWLATEASLNHELRSDLPRLRARGRELLQNNDYAVKFAGMVKNNIIGAGGIRLQVRVEDNPGKPDRIANAAIEAAWLDWCTQCDVTGRQTLRDVCETLVGGLPSDGEFLVHIVRGQASGNKYGLGLQVIDVDRIDTTFTTTPNGGNAVVMGVELDSNRRPVAVHLFAAHPQDGAASSRQRMRVPTADLLHCFKVERAEQARGIPWMAAGMLSLHHLGNFKLSALLAAEHGANHYGFFTTPDGQAPIGDDQDANGQAISTSQPGTYDTLPAGVTFTPHESRYPNEVFGPFVKTTLQRIASGWRVAYHSLANDLEGVSYSSIRSGALEERDRWAADQEWFIACFMEPLYKMWLQMALAQGAITMPTGNALPAAKLAKFAKHEWQPRRWEWVDPKGDMEAKILAVKAGLMAPQDLANAMGYDFDDTLSSIAAAQAMAKQLGVQLTAYDPTPGANGAVGAQGNTGTAAPAAQKALEPRANPELEAITRAQEKMVDIAQLLAQHATRAQPQPVINNYIAAAEPAITVAPSAAVVRNEITLPEQSITNIVHLPEHDAPAAPIVQVTIQPADVVVNNTHPSRAVQVVERDANDEITRTLTTYTP